MIKNRVDIHCSSKIQTTRLPGIRGLGMPEKNRLEHWLLFLFVLPTADKDADNSTDPKSAAKCKTGRGNAKNRP
jgi:hypothetical protein